MKTSAKKSTTTRKKPAKVNGVKYPDILKDLEGQRAAILAEAGVVLTNPTGLEVSPDVSDQASAEADQHFSFRIRERERKLLKKIDEALGRLATQTYGICESCQGDIPYKRWKARPVTTLCIECKTSQEEAEKSPR
jgi:DnaK suppressor protein